MSKLYFRLGEMKGFTAIDLADKKEGYVNPIRELLQNSWDASHEAGNSKCEVSVYIETIPKRQIPHIDEYEEVLAKAIKTAKDQDSFNPNSKQRVKPIHSTLKETDVKVLMFVDNGTGMKENQLDAIMTGGVSIKGDEKAGGSFGVGNLSSYSLSSLRYVLYATKYKDDNGSIKTLFTGSPILAGYKDGNAQRGNRGRIVTKLPDNESNPQFTYPEEPPDFIKSKMQSIESGTVVAVLGLSEDWSEDAEYAIVSNFFHPIVHGVLSINVHEGNTEKSISDDRVRQLIENKKINQRARGDNILSGKAVYQAWQAVGEKSTQKIIELGNSEKVHVYIKSDKNMDSVVVLIRNGMIVARHDSMLSTDMDSLRKDPNFEPFTAVIDVDQDNAPELFKLVKGAENPYHNRLQTKILDKADEQRLKRLFKELSEGLQKHLSKIERDSFDLPLFPISSKAEKAGGGYKPGGQTDEAISRPRRKRPPKHKPSNESEISRPPGPKPVNVNRNLDAKSAVRYEDQDTKWVVKLMVEASSLDARDDVYLSMCLAEDNDKEEVRTYLDFIAVAINEKAIAIPDYIDVEENGELQRIPANKSQVKLGSMEPARPYNIIAEVKKPDDLGSMKVALLPILGLKQRKRN